MKNREMNEFVYRSLEKTNPNLQEELEVLLNEWKKILNEPVGHSTELTPERIAEIRFRIKSKFYERDEVLEQVAESILHSPQLKELLRLRG